MNIEPETIMSGVNWSVQLIGLLSAWKQDRQAASDDQFQDFMVWLEEHNFQELYHQISQSEEVNRELHALLSLSMNQVNDKLDAIAIAVSGLMLQIEGISALDRAVFVDKSTLSTQSRGILKLFSDQQSDDSMTIEIMLRQKQLVFTPSCKVFSVAEQRFLEDDLISLQKAELIKLDRYSKTGSPIYSLTRLGEQLAQSLPAVEIRQM